MFQPHRTLLANLTVSANQGTLKFIRFLLVGLGNVAASYGAFSVLWILLQEHLGPRIVLALAYIFVSVPAFMLQRRIVFKSKTKIPQSAARYYVVFAAAIGFNFVLIHISLELLSVNPLVGQAVSLALVSAVVFFVHRNWTFKEKARAVSDAR